MLLNNLKLTLRSLLKNKVYSILIIGGFSIGFATCILIGLFYFTEKSVNSGFANHRQIYRLYDTKKNSCILNYDLNSYLSSNYSEITNTCPMEYFTGIEFSIKDEESNASTVINNIISTNNNFFEIFSVNVVESLAGLPFEGKESIVITESVAQRLFKNGNALGQTLNIDNFYVLFSGRITAVIKDLPDNSSFKAEILLNSDYEKFRLSTTCIDDKCFFLTNHYLQVNEGVNIDNLTVRLNSTLNFSQLEIGQLGLQNLADFYLTKLTIRDMHFKGNAKLLRIFLAVAVLILLLSSFNYLNYTISMQYARFKSIGISKTNGADWHHLAGYSITEVLLGIIVSVTLSLILTFMLLPFSGILFGKELHFYGLPVIHLLPVFAFVVTAVIVLNSMAPLYILSRFNVTDFLSGTKRKNGKQSGKQIMLTFQLIVSIALIAGVIGIFKQINFVKHSDLGFDKELLLRIDVPKTFQKPDALKQEMEKLTFVSGSAFSNGCPGKINLRMGSNNGENSFTVNCIVIGDEYLKTMGIELIEGREFHSGDINNVCLLNEVAVTRFGYESIKGEKFNSGKEGGYEIIGIAKNFHISSFYKEIEPVALIYNPDVASGMLSIRLMPGDIGQYINQLTEVWKKFFPYEIMNYAFYDEQFQSMYLKEEKMAKSITFFSLIAIILTCMGIIVQIFLLSQSRTKEIGIRKVNGATISEVIVLLNKDLVLCIVIALAVATPLAWYSIHKWLENFAYKTELSWWIFTLAGLLALVIALLTVSWQSWQAATRNPVEALRYE